MACRDRVGAGSYVVASIVHSSVASDGVGSFELRVASTAVASVATAEADSGFYAVAMRALVERFSAGAVAIETPTRCPAK